MKYYNFIKLKREKLGYSTRELGEKINVSGSYISMIENNKLKNPPSEEVIFNLCKVLEMTPEEETKFFEMLDNEILPSRVLEKIEKLKEQKFTDCVIEKELQKELLELDKEKQEKVLKFIREFLKN